MKISEATKMVLRFAALDEVYQDQEDHLANVLNDHIGCIPGAGLGAAYCHDADYPSGRVYSLAKGEE